MKKYFKTHMGYILTDKELEFPFEPAKDYRAADGDAVKLFDVVEERHLQYLKDLGFTRYFMAQCKECGDESGPGSGIPFGDADERNEWAKIHSAVRTHGTDELHRVRIFTEWK